MSILTRCTGAAVLWLVLGVVMVVIEHVGQHFDRRDLVDLPVRALWRLVDALITKILQQPLSDFLDASYCGKSAET